MPLPPLELVPGRPQRHPPGRRAGAVLTIQSNCAETAGQVEAAAELLCARIARYCGGSAAWAIADAASPEVTVRAGA